MGVHVERARSLLRIPANRKVSSLLEGEYVALHPGRSTEFTDLREYVRGDDPKDLDWKASARARTLLVRRYHAFRKLTVLLVVSTGRTMAAANSIEIAKREVALAAAAVLGDIAVRHGDLVGLVHGDGDHQEVLAPRGGAAHLERCLGSAHDAITPQAGPSDLAVLLHRVARSVRRRSFVIVVADAVEVSADVVAALGRIRAQHETLMVVVEGLDPLDVDPDAVSGVADVDSGLPVPSWLRRDDRLRREFAEVASRDRLRLVAELDRLGVTHVHLADLAHVVPAVRHLLERHRRARRR